MGDSVLVGDVGGFALEGEELCVKWEQMELVMLKVEDSFAGVVERIAGKVEAEKVEDLFAGVVGWIAVVVPEVVDEHAVLAVGERVGLHEDMEEDYIVR